MEEKEILKKSLNIKIPPEILSNMELSTNEKLVLSLDYTYSSKKGYNIMTNIDIGKLFGLHHNIVGSCRKRLIEKGYLIKDTEDKRVHILTDKLKSIEIPLVNGKRDKRTIILSFEIYNHPHLSTGAKLLFGEYNSMSKGDQEYFSKRDTTSKRLNASIGSITNWTKQLDKHGLLEKYLVTSEYFKKQKFVKTKDLTKEV